MKYRPLLAAGLLALTLAGCGTSDPLAYSKSQLELQQAQQAAQHAQTRAEALQPFSLAAAAAWYVALAAVPLVALGIGIDAYRQRRRPLVHVDHAGQLPVPRAMIDSGELAGAMVQALHAFHQTQAMAASQPRIDKLNITVKEAPALEATPRRLPETDAPLIAATDVPTLPSIVELSDVLPTVRGGHLAFGVLPTGELLQLPFGRAYHFLGAGDTRTGKTVMLDSLIVQLHHMARRLPVSLYGGDFKRELAATWHASPLFSTIETQPGAIADMLVDLVEGPDGVHRRYDRFKHKGQQRGRIIRNVGEWRTITGELPRLSIVVLDELNAVLEAAKRSDRVAESLKVLLQTGAGAGVYVLGGAQYLSSTVFSRDGSKQFVSRCLFGQYDDTAARMMFGSVDSAVRSQIDGTPGRGLIRTVSQAQPQPFQALHTSERDILDAIRVVAPRSNAATTTPTYELLRTATTTRATPLECAKSTATTQDKPRPAPTQHGRDMSEKPAGVAVTDEERLSIIKAAEPGQDGKRPSRTAICFAVFGTRGGAGYYKVQRVLDAAGL